MVRVLGLLCTAGLRVICRIGVVLHCELPAAQL